MTATTDWRLDPPLATLRHPAMLSSRISQVETFSPPARGRLRLKIPLTMSLPTRSASSMASSLARCKGAIDAIFSAVSAGLSQRTFGASYDVLCIPVPHF
jgi:hypothetical protein